MAKRPSIPKSSSPKATATIDPTEPLSEPAAAVVENDAVANPPGSGVPGGTHSSEVSTASSASDGLTDGVEIDAFMPAAPETAAGTNTAPADGSGSETDGTEGHDQAGADAVTAPAVPPITPADGKATAEVGSGDLAAPAESSWADLQAGGELEFQFVTFDLTRPPTEDEREAFKLLYWHMNLYGDPFQLVGEAGIAATSGHKIEAAAVGLADLPPVVTSAESFARLYPCTAAALDTFGREPSGFRIKAKVDGFRRGGIAHSREWVSYTQAEIHDRRLSIDAIEQLFTEPNLTVELF